MKSKKVLISLIVVLVVLGICVGAFAYVYFATDLLKTNSQLFAKYGQATLENIAEFFYNENVNSYYEKKLINNYENNGSLNVGVKASSDDEEIDINDEILTFKGAVDVANKKAKQDLKLRYSNKEKFAFTYVRDNDLYALASDEIVNKYITVENNNLKDLASKLGALDTTNIPDRIDLKEYESILTKEEIKALQTKYMSIITEQLTEEDFGKQEGKENVYVLTIRDEKLKTILINIMQELKNESFILDTLDNQDEINEFQEDVNTFIEELAEEDFSDINIQVTVENNVRIQLSITYAEEILIVDVTKLENGNINIYIKEENSNETEYDYETEENISGTNEFTLELSKNVKTDDFTYSINGIMEDEEININIDLKGISTNKVTETYSVAYLNKDGESEIEYSNVITFKENVDITELNDENSVILNTYNQDELNNLIYQLGEQLVKVNTEKIERVMQQIQNGDKDVGIIANMAYKSQQRMQNMQDALEKSREQAEAEEQQMQEAEEAMNQLIEGLYN